MKPILLIKTGGTIPGIIPVHGDFEDWFAAGLACQPIVQVDVHHGETLPDPGAVSAVVITGSAAMVSHREDWSETTADWLLNALGQGVPTLGVCYGHQLMAHALGGRVGPNPHGREMGTVRVSLDPQAQSDPLFGHYPAEFTAQTSHLEVVLELPDGAIRLGHTPLDENHLVRFAESAWGVQYHPEFSTEVMRAYVDLRAAVLEQEGFDARAMSAAVRPTPIAQSVLPAFARRFTASAAA